MQNWLTVVSQHGKLANHSMTSSLSLQATFALLAPDVPFSEGDLSAGTESELQAVVVGSRHAVDLPLTIAQSNYYANIVRRIATGDAPKRAVSELEDYLTHNREQVWENSWVRLPLARLSATARAVLQADLQADKRNPASGVRADYDRFFVTVHGEQLLRVPVSYLLKLALAEALGVQAGLPAALAATGQAALSHFLNDNSSPETYSLYVTKPCQSNGLGRVVAREKAQRFLLTQLLVLYANRRFGLTANGQRVQVYFAPHPPVRQRQLSDCLSDAFYRELLMSPCLAGWDDGAAKQDYMHLCHQVLSRSQLNAVAKLREAGIIANNLVVLPNLSNVSLANNGTHVSLGSRSLTEARRAGVLSAAQEKCTGDLTIKFVELFLPLFVGTYSAAPYRLAFADFHPERVLGFLPHELDYTHLRMLWRRWRGKADLRVCGYPLTPCGPRWLDEPLSKLFRLRGDWVVDYRLLDYLVALLSTEQSPALDGTLGNGERLKRDLAALGVFDERMALYLLYRQREFAQLGFSGFEGRYYSLFASLSEDLSHAVNLQILVTALACKLQAEGRLTHALLPDDPGSESERRLPFFAAAIGLPTFFVKRTTGNAWLQAILERTTQTRSSHRYAGYWRVRLADYQQALLATLRAEAPALIEMFGLTETLADLAQRLAEPQTHAASGKLLRGILGDATGKPRSPLQVEAATFNQQAETYYRETLCVQQLAEAFAELQADWRKLELIEAHFDPELRSALQHCLAGRSVSDWLLEVRPELLADAADETTLLTLINLVLLAVHHAARRAAAEPLAESADAGSIPNSVADFVATQAAAQDGSLAHHVELAAPIV